MPIVDETLSLRDAAKQLEMSVGDVLRAVNAGELGAIRKDDDLRFRPADLDAYRSR